MVKIMMHGCNGVMGQVISKIVEETEGAVMACGVDRVDDGHNDYPVFTDINACDVEVDAIIDFSAAPAVDGLLDFAVERQIPVVLCTTGLSDEQLERVHEASKKTAVLRSANMSLGVNTLFKVLKSMTKLLADAGFDIDIVEKHHRRKLDAPSGTAIALAEAVNEPLNNEYEFVYDRSQRREQRPKKEIGISAVRGGTIVGEHEVIFAGTDEVITFKHTAYSRAVFAKGSITAAKYLKGKAAGLYDMSDVLL
jgi:4-hydroxy-tetrahydrodipicolinate reductase